MKRFAVPCIIALAVAACVDPLTTQPVSTPAWVAGNVKGYAETAAGLPPEVVLGWDLVVETDVARWRECTAIEVCGHVERNRAASDLVAIEPIGRAAVDGRQAEVLKLSVAARPKYVVPSWKTTLR